MPKLLLHDRTEVVSYISRPILLLWGKRLKKNKVLKFPNKCPRSLKKVLNFVTCVLQEPYPLLFKFSDAFAYTCLKSVKLAQVCCSA